MNDEKERNRLQKLRADAADRESEEQSESGSAQSQCSKIKSSDTDLRKSPAQSSRDD